MRVKNSAKSAADEDLFQRVCDNAEVEIPDAMIEDEVSQEIQQLQQQLQQYGMSLTGYLQMMNKTADDLKKDYQENAAKSVKMRLVLEAIGKAENLEPTEEEIDKEMQNLADMYQMELSQVQNLVDRELLKGDVRNQKAYEFVRNSANGVPAEEEAEPAPAEEAPAAE